jgi:hypothetical protein
MVKGGAMHRQRLWVGLLALVFSAGVSAQEEVRETGVVKNKTTNRTTTVTQTAKVVAAPRVAVTDLTYENKVREYFKVTESHVKKSSKSSDKESATGSSSKTSDKMQADFYQSEGSYTFIDRGELRKFTSDVKGEMLKSGRFKVTQAKPYLRPSDDESAQEKIFDIIERIKQGYYPNADYVLFGTVSSVEFRDEAQPVQGTTTVSRMLNLDLVVDFSLIDTRTYEVKAAFSATGDGQDVRLIGRQGAVIKMNRGKVMSETSKSLAEDVIKQLLEQFDGPAPSKQSVTEEKKEEVIIYR